MKPIFTLLLFISAQTTFSQLSIKGIIKDAGTNEVLAGVTINEKGTQNSVVTQNDGSFSIQYSKKNSTFIISSVGYNEQETKVGGQSTLNIF